MILWSASFLNEKVIQLLTLTSNNRSSHSSTPLAVLLSWAILILRADCIKQQEIVYHSSSSHNGKIGNKSDHRLSSRNCDHRIVLRLLLSSVSIPYCCDYRFAVPGNGPPDKTYPTNDDDDKPETPSQLRWRAAQWRLFVRNKVALLSATRPDGQQRRSVSKASQQKKN